MQFRMIAACLLAATVALPSTAAVGPTQDGADFFKGVIKVTGAGVQPLNEPNAPKRRLIAKRVAQLDAYRRIAETVEGVHITSESTVKTYELTSDTIRSSVTALVKNAQIIEEREDADGTYFITLAVPLYGVDGLAASVIDTYLVQERTKAMPPDLLAEIEGRPAPSLTEAPAKAADRFTGVVIDARNLGAKPALAPALLDEQNQELYLGKLPVEPDDLVAQGPAAFVTSLEAAKSGGRVGEHPLVLKAKRVKGPFRADLVLGREEAQKLIDAEKSDDVLSHLAVSIIL